MAKNKLIRADLEFSKELKEINLRRITNGVDKEMKSYTRLTTAIRRHPLWQKIKEDIVKSPLTDDKKGAFTDLFVIIVVGFIAVVFFATWIFMHGELTSTLRGLGNMGASNFTDATNRTFGQVDATLPALRWIAVVIFFSMIIAMFVSNFLIKANPVFFAVYVFILIIAIVFSAYVSNAYETLLTINDVGPEVQQFTGMNYIFINLPIWITVVGFIGGIILFIGIFRDTGQGGSIV